MRILDRINSNELFSIADASNVRVWEVGGVYEFKIICERIRRKMKNYSFTPKVGEIMIKMHLLKSEIKQKCWKILIRTDHIFARRNMWRKNCFTFDRTHCLKGW